MENTLLHKNPGFGNYMIDVQKKTYTVYKDFVLAIITLCSVRKVKFVINN